MKRKRFTKDVIIFFAILALGYAWYLRVKPSKRYAQVFYQKGENCERKNCSRAKQYNLAKKVIHYDPEFSLGYTRLGNLYEDMNQEKKARELHEKAVALDRQNRSSLLKLGIYHFQDNEFDQALAYLEEVFSITTYGDALNYYIGRIYEKRGDYRTALRYYTRAYQMNPYHMNAFARMGAMDYLLGDRTRAVDFAEQIRQKGEIDLANLLEKYIQTKGQEEFRPDED